MISGRVVGKEIDENGNIKVATEYTLTDGSKKIGHTRYNAFNFSTDNVLKDVKAHCDTLMVKTWSLKQNQELLATDLSGVNHQCASVEVTKPDGSKITVDDK